MRTLLVVAAVSASTLIVDAPHAQAQGRGGGQPVQPVQMVKPDLYLVAGGGANSVARVTPTGVILVDTKMPGDANYNDLLAQIGSVSAQPVTTVIVTHHHADHTGNNDRFIAAGAEIIGHAALAANLRTYQFTPLPAQPTVTYTTDYAVRRGEAEVRVLHLGRAHTGGDSIVYYPDAKVVLTSDVVTVGATGPLVDYTGGGSALEWARTLDRLLQLDFDTAIPGAGPVLARADVEDFRTKFNTVIGRARDLVRQGVPKDELLSRIPTDDIGWGLRVPLIDAFYEELSTGVPRP